MDQTNKARTEEFHQGLHSEGYLERFSPRIRWSRRRTDVGSRLGSTTHVSVLDAEGGCATVTCSNGSCSGVIVPGTGLHLNNMLGEEDLNPHGYHRHEPGPADPEHDGADRGAPTTARPRWRSARRGRTGSARRSSRRCSAVVDGGLGAQAAVDAPRVHLEDGVVEAEPGVDPAALDALERDGWEVQRWGERNLYFGGAQAVARDRESGALSGGGDPRRGGAAVVVDLGAASERGRPEVAPVHLGVGGVPVRATRRRIFRRLLEAPSRRSRDVSEARSGPRAVAIDGRSEISGRVPYTVSSARLVMRYSPGRPLVAVALGGRPGGQVDRRLGVGGQHQERLARREPGHRALRHGQGERARQPARVDGCHNRDCDADASTRRHPVHRGARAALLRAVGARVGRRRRRGVRRARELQGARRSCSTATSCGARRSPRPRRSSPGRVARPSTRSLVELVATALELEGLTIWACAASVETMALTDGDIEGQLAGVVSTPRFLRDTRGARLLFV